MNYKKWLIEDLQNLQRNRLAIIQISEELETINAEFAAIKATNFDKMPTGSGDNIQEEKLLTAIAKKDEKSANLEYTKRWVSDMERALSQLEDDERLIVERRFINQEKYSMERLADELGYERTQIWRIQSRALVHLMQIRHGASFKS